MEDLLGVRVLEDAAGFATEETLEATALEVFLFPMLLEVTFQMLCWPLSASAGDAGVRHGLLFCSSMDHEFWRFYCIFLRIINS